jgi:hypothetical protein
MENRKRTELTYQSNSLKLGTLVPISNCKGKNYITLTFTQI